MLKENNTLKKLDFEECELQPEGLDKVIKGVQVNIMLETLDLLGYTIDDETASCLGKNEVIHVCPYMYERELLCAYYFGMMMVYSKHIMCVNVVFYVILCSLCDTRLRQMSKLQILSSVDEGFDG